MNQDKFERKMHKIMADLDTVASKSNAAQLAQMNRISQQLTKATAAKIGTLWTQGNWQGVKEEAADDPNVLDWPENQSQGE